MNKETVESSFFFFLFPKTDYFIARLFYFAALVKHLVKWILKSAP